MYRQIFTKQNLESELARAVQAHRMSNYPLAANADKRLFPAFRENPYSFSYLEANTKYTVKAILIDVDSNATVEQIRNSLPEGLLPASIVGRKLTNLNGGTFERPHLRFNLRRRVSKKHSRSFTWLKAISKAIRLRLSQAGMLVDDNAPPRVTKNPFSGAWDYHLFDDFASREWSLQELHDLLDLDSLNKSGCLRDQPSWCKKTSKNGIPTFARNSRNCAIFDEVRYKAYAAKPSCKSLGELHSLVLISCDESNRFYSKRLPDHEVRGIAKSIATWTWHNYTGSGSGRVRYREGAASHLINVNLSKKEKMAVGARFANELRTQKAKQKLSKTLHQLRSKNIPLTKKGVARASGLALSTVKKYWDEALQELKLEP
jgi:hypothetical protein